MARILKCGSCGKKFRPEDGSVGKHVTCPKCSESFVVAEKHYPPYDDGLFPPDKESWPGRQSSVSNY